MPIDIEPQTRDHAGFRSQPEVEIVPSVDLGDIAPVVAKRLWRKPFMKRSLSICQSHELYRFVGAIPQATEKVTISFWYRLCCHAHSPIPVYMQHPLKIPDTIQDAGIFRCYLPKTSILGGEGVDLMAIIVFDYDHRHAVGHGVHGKRQPHVGVIRIAIEGAGDGCDIICLFESLNGADSLTDIFFPSSERVFALFHLSYKSQVPQNLNAQHKYL